MRSRLFYFSNHKDILLRWILIVLSAVGLGTVVELFGLPGSHFFGGMIIGLLVAIFGLAKKGNIPIIVFEGSLAVTGVVLGAYFSPASLGVIAAHIIPILAVSIGTLILSLLLGILLSKVTDIPLPTSLLGMLAGGYAMNVITGDRIKADVRMVTLMHLIRLILVLIATPILIHFFLAPGTHLSLFAGGRSDDTGSFFISFCFTVLVALVGGWLGVKYSYSGSVLLTPLCLMVVLGLIPAFRGIIPPEGFREVATMVIGLQIGLRFNVGVLKRTKKYIPIITALMLVTIIGCGMFAWLLTAVTPMNAITAYLSTTPGGRTAVVSLAFTTGADPTSVLAIQTLRLLIMTILAPAAIGYIVKRRIASVSEDMELLE